MLKGLIGKKMGMTQFFTENGDRVPVTVVQTGPVSVIQKKTLEKDGYEAVQVGFEPIADSKLKNVTKPLRGHFKDVKPTRYLKEISADRLDDLEIGQSIDVGIFEAGELVDVTGTSKGRGYTGVMKRHGFGGGPGAHGHRFNRGSGSIGASSSPAKVYKNTRMAGQHGNSRVTMQRLEIVAVNKDLNVLLIKGAIPGPTGRLVEVRKSVKPRVR